MFGSNCIETETNNLTQIVDLSSRRKKPPSAPFLWNTTLKLNMFDHYNNPPPSQPTTPPAPQKVVRFDRSYVTTTPGLLKVVELACNLIGFICIKVSWGAWISAIFYNLLYWVGILVTGFLLLMYTFHLVEKHEHWPWLKLEFFFCVGMALIYIVLSIFATTIGESVGYAVGFFGLCAILAYGFDGYLKYKAWKRGVAPQ